MALLEQITTGLTPAPRRILIYGQHGVGKSTFGASAPNPIFIQTEDGLSGLDCARFPLAESFNDVMAALSALHREEHAFETVVIDSLDWLESHIFDEVCRERGARTLEDLPYGRGYTFALDHWKRFLEGVSALRRDRNMTVILIAHAKIERFANPETDTYDRYVPSLHKAASARVQEWADEVLFASFKVHTKQTSEGFDRKRVQGIGSGQRIVRTEERPSHVAKNRLGLPEELPLSWEAYASHINPREGA